MKQKQTYLKSVLDYSNRATTLLLAQLEKHKKTRQIVRSVLSDYFAEHVLDCIISEKKIIIYTDSAAWASQLRFYSPIILKTVEARSPETVIAVQVKVLLLNKTIIDRTEKRNVNIPSRKTIDTICNTMQSAPDSQLKKALLRLGKTLRKTKAGYLLV